MQRPWGRGMLVCLKTSDTLVWLCTMSEERVAGRRGQIMQGLGLA